MIQRLDQKLVALEFISICQVAASGQSDETEMRLDCPIHNINIQTGHQEEAKCLLWHSARRS